VANYNSPGTYSKGTEVSMDISVGPPIYIIGMLSFVGWIFFVLFGGVGLTALPLDLIIEFKNRPVIVNFNNFFIFEQINSFFYFFIEICK